MTKEEAAAYRKSKAAAVAAASARLFGTEDGRLVLADLVAKYAPDRPRFENEGRFDPDAYRAAFRDGQSTVVLEILAAVTAGNLSTNATHL